MKSSWIIASSHHQGSEKRAGSGARQDRQGLAAPGPRCANTAAGLRYVLYTFLSELERPYVITHQPADISWRRRARSALETSPTWPSATAGSATKNGDVYIYYGASDTRLNVITSTVEKLLDLYDEHAARPACGAFCGCGTAKHLIRKNLAVLKTYGKLPGRPQERGRRTARAQAISSRVLIFFSPSTGLSSRAAILGVIQTAQHPVIFRGAPGVYPDLVGAPRKISPEIRN